MQLEAFPYHLKIRDHFRQQPKTWTFFAASGTRSAQLTAFQTDLLKNTYQFRPENEAFLYDKINLVKEKLGLVDLTVTAYQAEYTQASGLNASIVYLNQEAHLVFSGPVTGQLDEAELQAIIAHELSHVKLFQLLDGDLEVTDRIITAIANHDLGFSSGVSPYYETARLFRLYTEIYCDRGAYTVLGDIHPVISMLVKIATGLSEVHAENYIKQAEDIFSRSPDMQSATLTHPENFIRARALELWRQQGTAAEPEISRMIEGLPEVDRLDILSQKEWAGHTRTFLQSYLQPAWFRTELVTALAKQYFSDFAPTPLPEPALLQTLTEKIGSAHTSLKEYFSYVLLDFTLADPSLEEAPAGRAFHFAETMQLTATYDQAVKKELQFSDRRLQLHKQKVLAAYKDIRGSEEEGAQF